MYRYTLSMNDHSGYPVVVYANSRQSAVVIAFRKLSQMFPRSFTLDEVRALIIKVEKIQFELW